MVDPSVGFWEQTSLISRWRRRYSLPRQNSQECHWYWHLHLPPTRETISEHDHSSAPLHPQRLYAQLSCRPHAMRRPPCARLQLFFALQRQFESMVETYRGPCLPLAYYIMHVRFARLHDQFEKRKELRNDDEILASTTGDIVRLIIVQS
jgi:hypothetical protein